MIIVVILTALAQRDIILASRKTCSPTLGCSMTASTPRISKCLASLGDKLPVIALRMESKFQHPKGVIVAHLALRLREAHLAMGVFASATDHKLANTVRRIGLSLRVLRCKTLVVVVVAAYDDISTAMIERVPKRFHRRIIAMFTPGTKQWLVEVRKRACGGMLL